MGFAPDEFTGTRLGRYELLCRIAVGGAAEIFLALARREQAPVVLKRLLPEHREDPEALQLLLDEARLYATLSHPNIARMLDLTTGGEDVVLVMEFIPGATLLDVSMGCALEHRPVPLGFTLGVMRACCEALRCAHDHVDARGRSSPVIHRDVGPKNVMVTYDGRCKLLDFGIARAWGAARRTEVGMVRGTTSYMSPEQATNAVLDHRTDLFSLGVVFHELLTGRRLFAGATPIDEMRLVMQAEIPRPSLLATGVPPGLDDIVLRLLERPVARRYARAGLVAADLEARFGAHIWSEQQMGTLLSRLFADRRDSTRKLVEAGPEVLLEELRASTLPGLGAVSRRSHEPQGVTDAQTQIRTVPRPSETLDDPQQTPSQGITPAGGRPTMDEPATPEAGSAGVVPADASNIFERPTRAQAVSIYDQETVRRPTPVASRFPPGPIPSVDEWPASSTVRSAERSTTNLARRARVLAAGLALVFTLGVALALWLALRPAGDEGTGRLSILTDVPAQAFLGEAKIGRTPFADVYVPSGKHPIHLIGQDGVRRVLWVDVPRDGVAKAAVQLADLAEAN